MGSRGGVARQRPAVLAEEELHAHWQPWLKEWARRYPFSWIDKIRQLMGNYGIVYSTWSLPEQAGPDGGGAGNARAV